MVKRKFIDPEDRLIDGLIKVAQNSQTACIRCKHLFGDGHSCAAFPDQIPDRFLTSEIPHTEPARGQGNKIVFEQRE